MTYSIEQLKTGYAEAMRAGDKIKAQFLAGLIKARTDQNKTPPLEKDPRQLELF